MNDDLARAAAAVCAADRLIITAGAGMGVDSGLPDFRGPEGFWKAYPPYRKLGLGFTDLASPGHFLHDPAFAWGFYGHRLQLYRDTVPHGGFGILLRWAQSRPAFVVTSNVDGQFQRAGFADTQIYEIHGSVHHQQCLADCGQPIWSCTDTVVVDQATMRAATIPACPRCGAVARPNILMFGDGDWRPERSDAQAARFDAFAAGLHGPAVVIEIGAGTAIPSIRRLSEQLGRSAGVQVIRINPREARIERPHLSLAMGGLDGLRAIDALR